MLLGRKKSSAECADGARVWEIQQEYESSLRNKRLAKPYTWSSEHVYSNDLTEPTGKNRRKKESLTLLMVDCVLFIYFYFMFYSSFIAITCNRNCFHSDTANAFPTPPFSHLLRVADHNTCSSLKSTPLPSISSILSLLTACFVPFVPS